jgi:hypothetical protein
MMCEERLSEQSEQVYEQAQTFVVVVVEQAHF